MAMTGVTCDVCGLPIDTDDDNSFHSCHGDDDCPNRPGELAGHWRVDCECDNRAHAECCPRCAEWVVRASWLDRWVVYWSGTRKGWVIEPERAHRYVGRERAEEAGWRALRRARDAADIKYIDDEPYICGDPEVLPWSMVQKEAGQ